MSTAWADGIWAQTAAELERARDPLAYHRKEADKMFAASDARFEQQVAKADQWFFGWAKTIFGVWAVFAVVGVLMSLATLAAVVWAVGAFTGKW